MFLVGFGHAAQVGKSTCAQYLVDKYGFKQDSLAASLKEGIGKAVFGFSDEQMETGKEIVDDFWGLSPRQVLQKSGTDGMRTLFGEDIWIKTLSRRIDQDNKRNYAISDVRFTNEADAIKSWGGILIRIDRDIKGTSSIHVSEQDLHNYPRWDWIIKNDGDFHTLYRNIDTIMSYYKKYLGRSI